MKTARTTTWANYTLALYREAGHAAHRNRGRYSGAKVHLVSSQYIIGVANPDEERSKGHDTLGKRFLKSGAPVLFSASPYCGVTGGQNAARPNSALTLADVTCVRCRKLAAANGITTLGAAEA